jgi:hypothetical protein
LTEFLRQSNNGKRLRGGLPSIETDRKTEPTKRTRDKRCVNTRLYTQNAWGGGIFDYQITLLNSQKNGGMRAGFFSAFICDGLNQSHKTK